MVILAPDKHKYTYQSEAMIYLWQFCPTIAAIEKDSELVETMHSEDYRFSLPLGNSEGPVKLFLQFVDRLLCTQSIRPASFIALEIYFSSSAVLGKWPKLVGQSCQTS